MEDRNARESCVVSAAGASSQSISVKEKQWTKMGQVREICSDFLFFAKCKVITWCGIYVKDDAVPGACSS